MRTRLLHGAPAPLLLTSTQRACPLTHAQNYLSGVITGQCGDAVDHGVLAVGYGTDPTGGSYYKIKNSWGATWGEAGYVRIGRGASFPADGQCGILTTASYPVV